MCKNTKVNCKPDFILEFWWLGITRTQRYEDPKMYYAQGSAGKGSKGLGSEATKHKFISTENCNGHQNFSSIIFKQKENILK